MYYTTIAAALLFGLSPLASAQNFDSDDFPVQCRSVCTPVVSITESCQRDLDDDDQLNCICTANNAASSIPLCEACYATYDRNDGSDNDVNDLVMSCSFTRTTYNTAEVSTATANTGTGLIQVTGSSTITTSSTIATDIPTTTTSDLNAAATTNEQTPSPTTDAAAGHTPHWLARGGGVLAGAFVMLW